MYRLLENIKKLIKTERYNEAYIENLKFDVKDKRDLVTLDAIAYSMVCLYDLNQGCVNAILYGRDSLVYNYFIPDMAYSFGCHDYPAEEGDAAIKCKNYELVHTFANWGPGGPTYEYHAEAAIKHGYFSENANEEERKIADLIVKGLLRQESFFIDIVIKACGNDVKLKEYFTLIKKCAELSKKMKRK